MTIEQAGQTHLGSWDVRGETTDVNLLGMQLPADETAAEICTGHILQSYGKDQIDCLIAGLELSGKPIPSEICVQLSCSGTSRFLKHCRLTSSLKEPAQQLSN